MADVHPFVNQNINADLIAKANHIVNTVDEACFGVLDEAGFPSVSTISTIQSSGIFKAYFATDISGNKATRLQRSSKASICCREGGNNVTLVGEAVVLTDKAHRHALWQDWFIQHFSSGKDDPDYCIIKFTTIRASLWIDGVSVEFQIADIDNAQSRCGLLCNFCTYKETCGCGGCIETDGHPFHGECPVAVCCQNKGYAHCGECPDMPCTRLHAYSCEDKEHGDNPPGARLDMLRAWNNHEKRR